MEELADEHEQGCVGHDLKGQSHEDETATPLEHQHRRGPSARSLETDDMRAVVVRIVSKYGRPHPPGQELLAEAMDHEYEPPA